MYVSLALVVITALIVLFNLIKGVIRGLKKTIGTLVAIILSLVVALIVTLIICSPDSSLMVMVIGALEGLLSGAELQDILGIEELGVSISYYISMIAAPFVFVLLYCVISIIFSIIVGIVIRFIPPRKKFKGPGHRLGGLGVGVVCGIIVSSILLMPIVGILNIVASVGESDVLDSMEGMDEISELMDEAAEDKVLAVYTLCSGWMFDSFASATFEGEKVYLKDDIAVILAIVGNLSMISGDVATFEDKQIEALNDVVDDLDTSPLLKNTLAGVLSQMASKWIAGDTFVGIERIDAGSLLNPVIDSVLEVMASSEKETITEDMTTLIDILDVMVDYRLLENVNDFEKMLEILSHRPEADDEESAIEALLNVANANPRMMKLSDEVTKLSIRALASTLEIPENSDERYDLLINDIAVVLNESRGFSDREVYVEEKIIDAFETYGVEVSDEAAQHIAESMLDDLGNISDVQNDAVEEFFMMYAAANHANGAALSYSGFETLAQENFNLSTDPTTGAVMMGDYVFKYYDAYTYDQSAAFAAGRDNVDFGDADTLYSAQSMKSKIITLADIFDATGGKKFSDLSTDEAKRESKRIADMLILAGDMFNGNFTDPNYKLMIKEMGGVLDKMCEMQIFGEDATAKLLEAIFQSRLVKDSLGLPVDKLDQYAHDIIESAQKEGNCYLSVTKSVGGMLDMMDKVSNKNATREEKIQVTKELISDMTPENARLLSTMTTPDMVKGYVKNEEKAETVSNSVSSLFSNMADFDTDDEEEYNREADAVNAIVDLATNASSSEQKSVFSRNGEEGKIDATPDEFVSLLSNSEVAGKTVKDTLESEGENPYGIRLNEEDENDLNAALIDRYNNRSAEEDADELIITLTDIALIMNATPPQFN